MPRVKANGERPNRGRLYEKSFAQGGFFTLFQAQESGFSRQLLRYMQGKGEIERRMRGIYRWAFVPPSEEEELIQFWLWSNGEGVFSHETSLFLHHLSDALPNKIHLSVPSSWSGRRLKLPEQLVLHYVDLSEDEVTWFGAVKVTKPIRTLVDCVQANLPSEWIEQAIEEAAHRGLFSKELLVLSAKERGLDLSKFVGEGGG